MRTQRLALSLAVPAAVLLAAYPAAASTPDPLADPASAFTLSIEDEAGVLAETTLECEPTGGSHPQADGACSALAEVDGDVSAVSYSEEACVFIYAPVTAHLSGKWDGSIVEYQETFPNRCVLVSEKGPIFGF